MSSTTQTVISAPERDGTNRLGPLVLLRALLLARVTWIPLTAYAISVVTHISILWAMTGPGQPWNAGIKDKLTSWDGKLLIQIAQHGYPNSFTYGSDGKLTGNNLAFTPLYPLVIRMVHGLSGLSYPMSAIVVAHISFIVLLVIVNTLVGSIHGRKTATIAVFLMAGAQPMGIVFLMGYTEALFAALAMASLLALYRRHWLTAGILASLAGLTRPVGVAVSVTVAIAVVTHLLARRRFEARPVLALFLGSIGLPVYLVWVGMRVGAFNAWFTIQQAGWGTHWDNGRSSFELLKTAFTKADGWVMISTAVLMTIIATVTLSSWRSTWLPFAIYGTVVLVMTVGQSNYYHCKLRLLAPAIVVVVPIARSLANSKKSTMITSIVMGTLFSSWYGSYMLTVWHYAI
jgi:hypothetical protein